MNNNLDMFSSSLTSLDASFLLDSEFYLRLTLYITIYAIFCIIWRKVCQNLSVYFKKKNKNPSKLYYYCLVYTNPVLEIVVPIILIIIFAALLTITHKNQMLYEEPKKTVTSTGIADVDNVDTVALACNTKMKQIKAAVIKYNNENGNTMKKLNIKKLINQTANDYQKYLSRTPKCPSTNKNTYVSKGDLTNGGTIKCVVHGKLKENY